MSLRKRALLASALGFAICSVYACSGAQNGQAPSEDTPPAGGASEEPGERESEPSQPVAAPHGKRAPCSSDQSCNENPAVSALWGRCTDMGICECNPGFERSPTSDLCRPAQ
jgi:hypothetical protein